MEPPRNRSATWTTLRSVRGPLVLSALAGLVCESFSAVFPGLNQMLVDDVLVAKTMSLPHIALLYSGCALGVLVFSYVTGILAWRMGLRYEQRLKNTYIERLWSLPTWKARQTGVTGHVSRLSNDITVIEQDYVTPFRSCLIYAPLIVVYAVLVTLFTTPLITMILLVGA
jgi:ABC-type bacteriocin/lantibiotic exporter with double-glycine peptidase domain